MKTFIIFLWLSFLDLSDLCSNGGYTNTQPQFGPGCMYRCHCEDDDQCEHINGTCPRGCAAGWMGPGCQYGDVAYNKQVRQLLHDRDSLADGRNATDGLQTTCIGPTTWIEIDLNSTYKLSGLVLNWESFHSYEVIVGNYSSVSPSDGVHTCFRQTIAQALDVLINAVCTTEIVGRYLLIKSPDHATPMTLCDVRVYGGRSLAYRHNASQSTTLNSSIHGTGEASRAVDGNTNTMFGAWSCSHSITEISPWWRVDLAAVYDIMRVVLYGRSDCCTERLSGFSLSFARNKSFHMVFMDSEMTPPLITEVITLSSGYSQQIEISLSNKTLPLTLCEVFVYGDCPEDVCGWTCDISCYCKRPVDKQNMVQGICSGGCKTGWWGYTCNNTCDKNCIGNTCNQSDGYCLECSQGKFGHFCEQRCTNCLNGTGCDIFSGICTVGCLIGHYGYNCNEQCGENCADDGSCNISTGSCIHGCQPGWKEDNCSIACPRGLYGNNCKNRCGQCANQTCEHINGICPMGCSDGYNGTNCSERLQNEEIPTGPVSALQIFVPVGVTVIAVVGLTILISLFAIIYWKRRRERMQESCEIEQTYDQIDKTDVNQSGQESGYSALNELCLSPVIPKENTYENTLSAKNVYGQHNC